MLESRPNSIALITKCCMLVFASTVFCNELNYNDPIICAIIAVITCRISQQMYIGVVLYMSIAKDSTRIFIISVQ